MLFRVSSVIALTFIGASCSKQLDPFSAAFIDRSTAGLSMYPLAKDPRAVGTFPGMAKSGAGYFYDEVLEYPVWMHPERGARKLAGNEDYFAAFARYESAASYAKATEGAEEAPLVLVRQRESVNEPTPGVFEWVKTERITEWNVEWLQGTQRTPTSIPRFLAEHAQTESK